MFQRLIKDGAALESVRDRIQATSKVDVGPFAAGIEAMYGEARSNARVVGRRGTRAQAFVELCCGALNITATVCAVLDLPSEFSPPIGSPPNPLSPDSRGHSALYHLVSLDVWHAEIMDLELDLDAVDLAAIANSVGATEPLKLNVLGHQHVGRPHVIARVLASAVRQGAFEMMGVACPANGTVAPQAIAESWKNLGTTPFPIKGLTEGLFDHLRVLVYEQFHRVASSSTALATKAPSRKAPGEGMSKEEANVIAKALIRKDDRFASKTVVDWAEAIGCSTGTVAKLPIWMAVMENRRKQRAERKPREKQLSRKMMASVDASGKFVSPGGRQAEDGAATLENLVNEQCEDLRSQESASEKWQMRTNGHRQ